MRILCAYVDIRCGEAAVEAENIVVEMVLCARLKCLATQKSVSLPIGVREVLTGLVAGNLGHGDKRRLSGSMGRLRNYLGSSMCGCIKASAFGLNRRAGADGESSISNFRLLIEPNNRMGTNRATESAPSSRGARINILLHRF